MSKQYDNTNRGTLFRDEKKANENSPDMTGTLDVDGVQYRIAGWTKVAQSGRKFLSLAITKKEQPPAPDKPMSRRDRAEAWKAGAPAGADDDIPF